MQTISVCKVINRKYVAVSMLPGAHVPPDADYIAIRHTYSIFVAKVVVPADPGFL